MQVLITENYDELSEVAASIIIEEMQKKKDIVLGLATGSTPIGTYQNLVAASKNNIISFADAICYNLDEYLGLNKDHEQSYHYFMNDNLFNHVDIKPDNINIPAGDLVDANEAVNDYIKKLALKERDIQILGIGENGHIGFNEPGTSFASQTHITELSLETRESNKRFFNNLDEVPKYAITMGISEIMAAKKILLLISGKNKAKTVKELLEGYRSEAFPASVLLDHDNITLVVDKEAMSLVE
ncbi:glucosamine-6-phosphate deaminase [Erysipelotrichaceae bacterium OttesenSCG-928-M19]|nr:glucosamine-6-phosphate deaminase [Erysipelotrichaceae bacterium OttesenSCG-928-M19]